MTTTPVTRRQLMVGAAATSVALTAAACAGTRARAHGAAPLRPARLREGDLVALVAPAKVTHDREVLRIGVESLEALGLRVTVGEHVLSRYGYLAGRDRERAADINGAFADDEVRGLVALRGGWGAARALPWVDFDRPRVPQADHSHRRSRGDRRRRRHHRAAGAGGAVGRAPHRHPPARRERSFVGRISAA